MHLGPSRHHCLTRLRFPGRRPPRADHLRAPAVEHGSDDSRKQKQACFRGSSTLADFHLQCVQVHICGFCFFCHGLGSPARDPGKSRDHVHAEQALLSDAVSRKRVSAEASRQQNALDHWTGTLAHRHTCRVGGGRVARDASANRAAVLVRWRRFCSETIKLRNINMMASMLAFVSGVTCDCARSMSDQLRTLLNASLCFELTVSFITRVLSATALPLATVLARLADLRSA